MDMCSGSYDADLLSMWQSYDFATAITLILRTWVESTDAQPQATKTQQQEQIQNKTTTTSTNRVHIWTKVLYLLFTLVSYREIR